MTTSIFWNNEDGVAAKTVVAEDVTTIAKTLNDVSAPEWVVFSVAEGGHKVAFRPKTIIGFQDSEVDGS